MSTSQLKSNFFLFIKPHYFDYDKVMISSGLSKLHFFIPRLEFFRSFCISRTTFSVEALTSISDDFIKDNEKRLLKIAIVGAPNAGKSTLINQIVKRKVSFKNYYLQIYISV